MSTINWAERATGVRIDGRIYELRAVRVTDPALRTPILKDRGYDPVPDGIVLFRFEPRA